MKFFIVINTTEYAVATVGLADSAGVMVINRTVASHSQRSTKVLAITSQLLKKRTVTVKNLAGIVVVSGPGGFSSTRSGVVIANTLAWAWKIPVIGLELKPGQDILTQVSQIIKKSASKKLSKTKFVAPIYSGEPNIGRK